MRLSAAVTLACCCLAVPAQAQEADRPDPIGLLLDDPIALFLEDPIALLLERPRYAEQAGAPAAANVLDFEGLQVDAATVTTGAPPSRIARLTGRPSELAARAYEVNYVLGRPNMPRSNATEPPELRIVLDGQLELFKRDAIRVGGN